MRASVQAVQVMLDGKTVPPLKANSTFRPDDDDRQH